MKKYLPAILISLAVVAVLAFVVMASNSKSSDNTSGSSANLSAADKKELEAGISRGPADSKVVLTEFADFQCPACAATKPLVDALETQYGGKYRLVFKNYPLPMHKNAMTAALAGEAANAQGKFWPMYDILYTRQNQWNELADPTPKFVEYAKELGMDTAKFEQDVKNKTYQDKIKADMDLGGKVGIEGTPTFFLNGEKLEIVDDNTLKQKVGEAVAKTGS